MDPLASWNDGGSKQQILDFAARVTDPNGTEFVPESERIATFDNDGTLWSESPLYFQLLFAVDRVPRWSTTTRSGAPNSPSRRSSKTIERHSGAWATRSSVSYSRRPTPAITAEEFAAIAQEWLDTSRHPRFDRPFDEIIYQPMLDVLSFLRANGQDLHRLRRRDRVHPHLFREGLRYPSRSGHR